MVTRALTKTLHLHEHFEHTHSVQNLKSNPRFLTASAVSVERRSLESLVNFKVSQVSRWDPIRGPDEFFEARRLIGFWLPCGQNGAFLASEQRQVSRRFRKKKKRKEEMKKWSLILLVCALPLASFKSLCSKSLASTWKRGNLETMLLCLLSAVPWKLQTCEAFTSKANEKYRENPTVLQIAPGLKYIYKLTNIFKYPLKAL